MPTVRVEKISERCMLGEGPHWDADRKLLYFVDIPGKQAHKYDTSTDTQKTVNFDEEVSFIIPVKGEPDKFVITQCRKVVLMTWDGESSRPAAMEVIASVDDAHGGQHGTARINDGKADATGRLWAGTLSQADGQFIPEKGILFSLSKNRSTKTHASKITVSNGIAWSLDNKVMYYIDSPTKKIVGFDFDIAEGKIANRRTIFDFDEHGVEGTPDGQTIDTDGNLWVACFRGKQVIQVDPVTGQLLQRLAIPAANVTSVAWGGSQLDELLVTTASILTPQEQLQQLPLAGCTFRVTGLGFRGFPGQPVLL